MRYERPLDIWPMPARLPVSKDARPVERKVYERAMFPDPAIDLLLTSPLDGPSLLSDEEWRNGYNDSRRTSAYANNPAFWATRALESLERSRRAHLSPERQAQELEWAICDFKMAHRAWRARHVRRYFEACYP